MTYAIMLGLYGWTVLAIDEHGTATIAANTGHDQHLAEQLRDWLTHRDRIQTLLDRHGLDDVPLETLP